MFFNPNHRKNILKVSKTSFLRLYFFVRNYWFIILTYIKKMESRSYMFSTAKKRSTLLESKGIEYESIYADSRKKIPVLPACVFPRRNAQMSTIATWIVSQRMLLILTCVFLWETSCSCVAGQDSRRQTLTLTMIIDLNKAISKHNYKIILKDIMKVLNLV